MINARIKLFSLTPKVILLYFIVYIYPPKLSNLCNLGFVDAAVGQKHGVIKY